MAKRTGEAAPSEGGQKCQIRQNEPRAAARATPVPSPSRLNPRTRLSVENSPVFFLLFTGRPIFALAAVVPALSLRKYHSVAKPSVGKNPAARSSRDSRAVLAGRTHGSPKPPFGQTNPRRQPGQHLAKRSQGAARSRLWPNKPKLPTSPRLRQPNPTSNRAARVSANEPKVQPRPGLG